VAGKEKLIGFTFGKALTFEHQQKKQRIYMGKANECELTLPQYIGPSE
jgi:hypothetical protein